MKKGFHRTNILIKPRLADRIALLLVLVLYSISGSGQKAEITIDAGKVMVSREHSLIGANIEDLNYQLYGGLYSQLIHGECFEEHVDPCMLLGLQGKDRLRVWTVINDQGIPVLRYFRGVDWGQAVSHRPAVVPTSRYGDLNFVLPDLSSDSLPESLAYEFLNLATGNEQISRHWQKVQSGDVSGNFTLVRQGVFTGRQAQRVEYVSGIGELGIDNAGLFRTGIHFQENKPYEGILRIKCESPLQIFVSLRSSEGRILAEQSINLEGMPQVYQRIAFELISSDSDSDGRFAITLKTPGTITIGYAFLQAGSWGRYHDQPVRKELAEAILDMGVKSIRYNGSMVNKAIEADAYKWKNMIAPRDQREPYIGWFNPYASHGYTIFDLLDFCEKAGVFPIIGVRDDETEQDMADLIEYCLGDHTTEWGRKRIESGHPGKYHLKAIQIGNEAHPTPEYFRRFKNLATAIWSRDSSLDVVLSINVGRHDRNPQGFIELVRWAMDLGQAEHIVLDAHYLGAPGHASADLRKFVGLELHDAIEKEIPGYHLRLWPMEENGNTHDWGRGLSHAHNLNVMHRMPLSVERAGAANTLQAYGTDLVWNQGRIHFTSSQIVFQPSYYIDRMHADEWLPHILTTTVNYSGIDVLGKKSEDDKVLSVYIVNTNPDSVVAVLDVKNFFPVKTKVMRIQGKPSQTNTPENPLAVSPERVDWSWNCELSVIQLPGYSVTHIRLEE